MYNRYQGNTGRVQRIDDRTGQRPARASQPEMRQSQSEKTEQMQRNQRPKQSFNSGNMHQPQQPFSNGNMHKSKQHNGGIFEQLGKMLPGSFGELETEDIILLLILYLMYRESGDSDLLIIMGAMFLL